MAYMRESDGWYVYSDGEYMRLISSEGDGLAVPIETFEELVVMHWHRMTPGAQRVAMERAWEKHQGNFGADGIAGVLGHPTVMEQVGEEVERPRGAYFGEPWPSDVCEHAERTSTPVGESCLFCGESIAEGDRGGFIGEMVGDQLAEVPAHRECILANVNGGIGHLLDHDYWCGERGDPEGGVSYRQSALLAWSWMASADHQARGA